MEIGPHMPAMVLIFGALAAGYASPGPTMLAVMGTALKRGRGPGLRLGLGVGIGTGLWALASIALLAPLFPQGSVAVSTLRVFASVFLLLLAGLAFRSAFADRDLTLPVLPGEGLRLVLGGTFIALANPKAAVFWLAVAAVAMRPDAPWSIVALLALGAAAISVTGHAAYAVAFANPGIAERYGDRRRPIQAVLGGVFCVLSLLVLTGAGQEGLT